MLAAASALAFAPDAVRGRSLDRAMRDELAGSLRHLVAAAMGAVRFDAGAVSAIADALERGVRFSPFLFATYYELAQALIDEELARAQALFAAVADFKPIEDRFRIAPLGCGASGRFAEQYVALMCADPSVDLNFLPPDPAKAAAFIARLQAAAALMDRAAPNAIGEIRAIIDEIVIVAGDKSRKMQFDGGSHFQLWGALFLNCDYHVNVVAAAEVLAHESAHSFLFGCCRDEMLVENEDEETFASPLRIDPRPMDGIYHATFVSARMHWVMSALLDSGLLSEEERAFAETARAADASNFAAGLGVVEAHGRLTRTGAALMQGAKRYMQGAVGRLAAA